MQIRWNNTCTPSGKHIAVFFLLFVCYMVYATFFHRVSPVHLHKPGVVEEPDRTGIARVQEKPPVKPSDSTKDTTKTNNVDNKSKSAEGGAAIDIQDDPEGSDVCPNVWGQEHEVKQYFITKVKYPVTKDVVDCSGLLGNAGAYINNELVKYEREELLFPLAFSIMSDGNMEQFERLLRAIYHPHNAYCVYYHKATPASFRESMETVAQCFDNVYMPEQSELSDIDVMEGYTHRVLGERLCMERLLKSPTEWKYFINLHNREFPLKTNLELVRILKAYRGGNDVEALPSELVHWTDKLHGTLTHAGKQQTPSNLSLYQGSGSITVCRDFVKYIMESKIADQLLGWMKENDIPPDTHFYSTLNTNPKIFPVPGAFTGKLPKRNLVQVQVQEREDSICAGDLRDMWCTYGMSDLYQLVRNPQLFAHRFYIEMSPLAFTCMEQWYRNRTIGGDQVGPGFNKDIYDKVPWASQHLEVQSRGKSDL